MVKKAIKKIRLVAATTGIFSLGFLLYYLICLGSYQNYVESNLSIRGNMSEEFNSTDQLIDFKWAEENGWEINGLLSYKHILFEFNKNKAILSSSEKIEQILMLYPIKDFDGQLNKIKTALKELIELKALFSP